MTDPTLWQRRLVHRAGQSRLLQVDVGQAWVDAVTLPGEAKPLNMDAQLAATLEPLGGTWSEPTVVPALVAFHCPAEGCDWKPHKPYRGNAKRFPETCSDCGADLARQPVANAGVILTLEEVEPPSELWLAEDAFRRKPHAGTARLLCEASAKAAGVDGLELQEVLAAFRVELARLPKRVRGTGANGQSNALGDVQSLSEAIRRALSSPHGKRPTDVGAPASPSAASDVKSGQPVEGEAKDEQALREAGLRPRSGEG